MEPPLVALRSGPLTRASGPTTPLEGPRGWGRRRGATAIGRVAAKRQRPKNSPPGRRRSKKTTTQDRETANETTRGLPMLVKVACRSQGSPEVVEAKGPMGSGSLLLSARNAAATLALSAITVTDNARGRLTKEMCDARLDVWARDLVRRTHIEVEVVGREHVDPSRTYVMVSNHQSFYDVPVVYYALGPNIRMVGKKELFDVPLFGPAMRSAGFIEVDRGDHARAVASMARAKDLLASGTHLWLAPEGTRSDDGALRPFKKGAFVVALDTRSPVLPVSLRGTREALVARGLRSRRGARVVVTIHPALGPEPYASMSPKAGREALLEDARASIARGL